MKVISKPLTWVLSLFNFGLYNLSDTIDSLVARLHFLGLKEQAEDIARLTEQIEFQQHILVMLDGLKFICMLVSLVVLIIANFDQLKKAYQWLKASILMVIRFFYKMGLACIVGSKNLFYYLFKSKF
jgi:ABC-type enterochelin transport system permease subunit